MRSNKDVEAYLLRLEKQWTEADDGTYVITLEGGVPLAIKCDPPLVLTRCEIGAVPATGREPLFEQLLRFNADALVHASYGLEDGQIVLSAALELENLDFNEIAAIVTECDLAISQQLPKIRELAGHGGAGRNESSR